MGDCPTGISAGNGRRRFLHLVRKEANIFRRGGGGGGNAQISFNCALLTALLLLSIYYITYQDQESCLMLSFKGLTVIFNIFQSRKKKQKQRGKGFVAWKCIEVISRKEEEERDQRQNWKGEINSN